MFPLAQVRKAGSEVILEEEEFGIGLSECGCPQEARLGLPHSQSPSPSRGKVSHPSAVPVMSLAWPLSLPFLWLNILISGITEAIFFFPS